MAKKYDFDKSGKSNFDIADAYCDIADDLAEHDNKHEEAIEYYNLALNYDSEGYGIYYNKATSLLKLARYKEALQCYDQAIMHKSSKDADSFSGKADSLYGLKRFIEALECIEQAIIIDPQVSSATYFSKGNILDSLERYQEAVDCYKLSIELKPNGVLDYCSLGRSLNSMGKSEEALQWFNKAYEIFYSGQQLTNLSVGNKLYIERILTDDRKKLLDQMESLQDASNKIQEKIAGVFKLANNEEVKELKEFQSGTDKLMSQAIAASLDNNSVNKDIVAILLQILARQANADKKLATYEGTIGQKLAIHDRQITILNNKVVTFEKFHKLASEEIGFLKSELGSQSEFIKHMYYTLEAANILSDAKIKAEFNNLKANYGDNVHDYANKFYWTLSNFLLAHRMLSTGMIEGKAYENKSALLEKVSGVLVKITSKIFESVPLAGNVVSLVSIIAVSISKAFAKEKSDRIIAKVNDSINNVTEENLNLSVLKAAIELAKAKASLINASESGQVKNFGKVSKWMSEKIDTALTKITGVDSVEENKVTKIALADVALLITWVIKSSSKLVKSGDKPEITGSKIANMYNGTITKQLEDLYKEDNLKSLQSSKKWFGKAAEAAVDVYDAIDITAQKLSANQKIFGVVFSMTGVEYNNKLLNHPELMEEAIKIYGASKVLDLSSDFNESLINEAIANNDAELVLAGCISLA